MKWKDKHMNMTIGQLASTSNTTAQTIRYYEQQELLDKPKRTESNYRVYDYDTIKRLTFIKRAKKIGFSLNDIKVLLGMADGSVRRCSEVQHFAETRLKRIRSQIDDLQSMEKTLSHLVEQCTRSNKIAECPIIETLTEKM